MSAEWILLALLMLLAGWTLGNRFNTRSEAFSREIFEHLSDGVILLSPDGEIAMSNGRAAYLLGLNEEDSDDARRMRLALSRAPELESLLKGNTPDDQPKMVRIGYPQVRHLQVTVVGMELEDADYRLMTLTDVTRLQELENMRREFTADLSHQIRTPLTSIKLLAETLQQNEQNREQLERIMQQVDRMQQLVEEILLLSRLEARETRMQMEKFSAGDLLRDAAKAVSSQAAAKNVDIVLSVENRRSWHGDYRQLQRVAEIYLDNAIKYSPAGATVEVEAQADCEDMRLAVTDEGPGIPEEELSHVFQRFYRGQGQPQEGFGLGLAIAKHTISAHGGEVFAESSLGRGSTFGFTIPYSAGCPREREPHSKLWSS